MRIFTSKGGTKVRSQKSDLIITHKDPPYGNIWKNFGRLYKLLFQIKRINLLSFVVSIKLSLLYSLQCSKTALPSSNVVEWQGPMIGPTTILPAMT